MHSDLAKRSTDKMVQGVDSCVNYVSKEDIPWKIRVTSKEDMSKEDFVKRSEKICPKGKWEDAPWKMIPYTYKYTCDTTSGSSASLDTPHGAPRER